MKQKSISYLTTILDETGLTVLIEDNVGFKTWRFIICIVIVLAAIPSMVMMSIKNYENFSKILYPVIATCALTMVIGGVLILFYHKKSISEMLHQMDNQIYVYSEEDTLDVPYPWYLKDEAVCKFMSIIFYLQYISFVFLSSPSILELFLLGEVKHYLYPCWTPWNKASLKWQMVTLTIQLIQSFLASWFNYIVMCLFLTTVLEFLKQYQRLGEAISTIERRSVHLMLVQRKRLTNKNSDGILNQSSNVIIKKNIIECIRHHQLLHQNFNLFKTWFSVIFSLELVMCAISFSLGFYVIFKALNTEQVVLYMVAVTIMIANIFIRCFIGEIFLDLNERIKNILFFDVSFLEINNENRRLLVTFHLLLCRPFRLYGFGIFEAIRSMFGEIICRAYSVFNVLNVSLNK